MSETSALRPTIENFAVPSQELLDALAPAAGAVNLWLWDCEHDPEGIGVDDIDAFVLPYQGNVDPRECIPRVRNLSLLQTQTTGYDGLLDLVDDGVAVATAAGVHAAATAELAVGLALASLRGIDDAARNQRDQTWIQHCYPGLADRRVLLVGVGQIGTEILRRLEPFDVTVTQVGRTARQGAHGRVHASSELVDLAPHHDVVIVITPLTEGTRGLISRAVLAALPEGALVVNVARGPVVDTIALTHEVLSGRLRAALDVVDPEPLPAGHPLWDAPGVLITPHQGGNSGAFQPRIVALLRRQLGLLNSGHKPENLVQEGGWLG